jgi:hypothetical protein
MFSLAAQYSAASAGWCSLIFAIACYFIPTIVALTREIPNAGSVVVINFFLGWTFIGWVVALAMAVAGRSR